MRVIIYGAGAIGGVIGARLFERDHDVTLVARGANYAALSKNGLRVETPDETVTLRVPVVDDLTELSIASSDVLLLTVKSHDTTEALRRVAASAPPTVAIVCAQNGVENERLALRSFPNVYGMCVICPATHLTPGVVQASSSPVNGLLDVGQWPHGIDKRSRELAAALSSSSFNSVARDDIARWKWGKLLMNLGNAVEAVCGTKATHEVLMRRALQEGRDVLHAAGIAFVDRDEDAARRGSILNVRLIGDAPRPGGSSWQSLVRATGVIETDYLTGEIVLQGRLHGVDTPVNELLQRLASQLATQRRPPGAWSESEVLAMLDG